MMPNTTWVFRGLCALTLLFTGCVDTEYPEWWEGQRQTEPGEEVGLTLQLEEQKCTPGQLLPAADALKLHFIDVGQGDAIWIQTPTGQNVLVDAGDGGFFGNRTQGADYVQAYLAAWGLPPGSVLDGAVVSHAHSDHYGGMIKLSDLFEFQAYIDPGLDSDNVSYKDMLQKMQGEAGGSVRYLRPAVGPDKLVEREGEQIPNYLFGNAVDAFLINAESATRLGSENNTRINNTSVVIRLEYAGRSVMLMGDAEQDQELDLLQRYFIDANILKVGHHGSDTSSSTLFLDAVFRNIAPDERYAIISSGRRSFSGTQLPTANTIFFLQDQVPRVNLFSTEAGDNKKDEFSAPGDDNILSVIQADGTMYSCYVPCSHLGRTCN